MKNTIVNILIFTLIFNVMMIVFPEGKTQKYCRFIIKIFIIIYVINNIFFRGSIALDEFLNTEKQDVFQYQRELTIKSADREIIDSLNEKNYGKEEVIRDIVLSFTDTMDIKAVVKLNKYLSYEEINRLKISVSEIFNIEKENILIE